MAKGIYLGVGGVARKVKKMYVGVGSVARKVKKAYVGVGGLARLFYSAGVSFSTSISIPTRSDHRITQAGNYALIVGGRGNIIDVYTDSLTQVTGVTDIGGYYGIGAATINNHALLFSGNNTDDSDRPTLDVLRTISPTLVLGILRDNSDDKIGNEGRNVIHAISNGTIAVMGPGYDRDQEDDDGDLDTEDDGGVDIFNTSFVYIGGFGGASEFPVNDSYACATAGLNGPVIFAGGYGETSSADVMTFTNTGSFRGITDLPHAGDVGGASNDKYAIFADEVAAVAYDALLTQFTCSQPLHQRGQRFTVGASTPDFAVFGEGGENQYTWDDYDTILDAYDKNLVRSNDLTLPTTAAFNELQVSRFNDKLLFADGYFGKMHVYDF